MRTSTLYLSIIVPAHNEESRLADTLSQLRDFCESQPFSTEIIIAENASIDRTLEIASDFADAHPGILVLNDERPGKGLAIQAGMLAAQGEYRFICDADLSMPVKEITRFLPPSLEGVDIAIASREAPGAIR